MNFLARSLLLVLAATLATTNDDVQITPLKNPILPIQLGNSKLTYTKHTFLHYIDLNPTINQFSRINNYFYTLRTKFNQINVTNPLSFHGLSESLLLRTEFLLKITQNKIINLHPMLRKKRGLINVVGKINKWLFGTLDSEDGDRYDQAIYTLQQDQKTIVEEANMQIPLSKNLIQNYNKTIQTLGSNQNQLENGLKILQISVGKEIQNISTYLTFQSVLAQINLDCQNLITFLDNLEDAIMFAKLNSLHNSIISSTELIQMIDYLKTIYKEDQIPYFNNILSYYQFFGTQISFSKTKIIFAIHVPIIEPETFTFYKLIPTIQNNQIFIPRYPYLARNYKKSQFQEEVCPSLEDTYYCQEEFTVEDNCTLRLTEGFKTQNCPSIAVHLQQSIVEQITREELIVMPAKSLMIYTVCRTNQYRQIDEPVLVHIPKNCQVQIEDRTYTNQDRLVKGQPLILPKIELEIYENPEEKMFLPLNLSKIDIASIYKLNDIASHLKPIVTVDNLTSQPSLTTYVISITIMVIVIFLISYWNRSILLSCCKRVPHRISLNVPNSQNEVSSSNPSEEIEVSFSAKNSSIIFAK